MKKLLLLATAGLSLCGCEHERGVDSITQEKQSRMLREAERQTGLPAIKNFQEKKMLKMLYELRDQENLVCYAYLAKRNSGEVGQLLGRCIGYGLPASTQYSNPEKIVYKYSNHAKNYHGSMPQAEPNGLFMPTSSSATWLMMLDDDGKPRPVYVEPLIIVSPFKLK